MEIDLYRRDPPFHFIRLNDVFYRWKSGVGWQAWPEPDDLTGYFPLTDGQRAVYLKALVEQGLVKVAG